MREFGEVASIRVSGEVLVGLEKGEDAGCRRQWEEDVGPGTKAQIHRALAMPE